MSLLSDAPERIRAWLAHAEAREAAGALAVIAGVIAVTIFSVRAGGKATPDRCDALLDRYVDFRVRSVDEHASEKNLDARKASAHERAANDPICRERLSEATAKCAAEAPSLDAFERCFP